MSPLSSLSPGPLSNRIRANLSTGPANAVRVRQTRTRLSATANWRQHFLQILRPNAQRVVADTVRTPTRMIVCTILLVRLLRTVAFLLRYRPHLRNLHPSLHLHLRVQYREWVKKRPTLLREMTRNAQLHRQLRLLLLRQYPPPSERFLRN